MTRAQMHIFPVSAREGIPQYGLDLGPARLRCTEVTEGATSVYTCARATEQLVGRELARRNAFFADGGGRWACRSRHRAHPAGVERRERDESHLERESSRGRGLGGSSVKSARGGADTVTTLHL